PHAYSYLRFSSPQQADGDSVRRQTELRDAWLKRNGAVLDTSVTLRDDGVSAYTGGHRQNPDRHALAAFLELVKRGRIPRGSYLIVESLDRLSREHVQAALRLILDLTAAGVRIVQLLPAETVFDEKSDMMPLMMAIMELSRGNSESKMKSERVGAAWRRKKASAAVDKKPITKRVPAWLAVRGGRFVVHEAKADAIRMIYRLATEGHGIGAITTRLNSEGVPPIADAAYWVRSYVARLLNTRLVLGEYQRHLRPGGRPTPDGPPISGYYPAVVTEDQWHAAQAAVAARRTKGGRPGRARVIGMFTGLLFDARDGSKVWGIHRGKEGTRVRLESSHSVLGIGSARRATFPADVFEQAVLSELREVSPRDILPPGDAAADRVQVLVGKLAAVEARIEKIKAQLLDVDDDDGADVGLDVLRGLERKRAAVAADLAEARRDVASPAAAVWAEFGNLCDALRAVPDPADARVRLRAALRRAVESMHCLFVAVGQVRLAAVRVQFRDTDAHRDYLISCDTGHGRRWDVRSFADVVRGGDFDLRKRKDAAKLAKLLETTDPADLEL
ncbi:MAG TPA: recombinase family protein, partial [Gemmataceae bacterium]